MSLIEQIKETARRSGLRRFWRKKPTPTNFQIPDTSPDAIAVAVDYALSNGRAYADRLDQLGLNIDQARFLEIGPGPAFGSMAYLRSHSAKVTVADRWLAPWSDAYHPVFYSALAERLIEEDASADISFLHRIIEQNAYDDNAIVLIKQGAENLTELEDAAIDVIFSNAVFEHLATPAQAFAELYRVTRPGGFGVHQVDFRDHRNFDEPLEHLLFETKAFKKLSERVNTEYGAQLRQPDYAQILTEAGFEILSYNCNCSADETYLNDLEKRLRRAVRSDYRSCSRAVLADLSGLFVVQRPRQTNREEQ